MKKPYVKIHLITIDDKIAVFANDKLMMISEENTWNVVHANRNLMAIMDAADSTSTLTLNKEGELGEWTWDDIKAHVIMLCEEDKQNRLTYANFHNLRATSALICKAFDIKGASDPRYITNTLAYLFKMGDRQGHAISPQPQLDDDAIITVAAQLSSAYGSAIKFASTETLADIIRQGMRTIPESISADLDSLFSDAHSEANMRM